MNILILSWRGIGNPRSGGAELVVHEHAKYWVKRGHNVTLFTSNYEGANTDEVVNGVKIIRKGNEFLEVHICAFLWYLFGRHEKFDLIFDHFHGLPFFTPLYVRIKKIAVTNEIAKEVWFLNYNLIYALIGYCTEPWIFKLIYKRTPFLTHSRSTQEALIDLGIPAASITVIPHGVTIKKPKVFKKEERLTIAYMGILSKDKGIEDALECFSLLKSRGDFNFWVIGKPESTKYAKKIEAYVDKLDLQADVKFWGYVSQNQKFNLLAKVHAVINPSSREGWGLVVIEAAAMGAPTIGYNVPGLRDSILDKKTGLICETNTPSDLAKNVIRLIKDQELYRAVSRNAVSWSRKFNWEKSVKMSLDLINRIIENG